jgi:hypothetical protein
MFRENHRHEQGNFFNTVGQLPRGVKKMMDKSWAPGFRELVFKKIDEVRYAELYSDIYSRPNFPVNVWVGLEIIKGMFDYTDEELLEQFHCAASHNWWKFPLTYPIPALHNSQSF